MKTLTKSNPELPIKKIQRLAEIETQWQAIKKERDQLREELLVLTQKLDVYTLKTGKYTLFRAKRVTPHVTDFNVLEASLKAQGIPYEVETVFSPRTFLAFQKAIKQKIELDGLEAQETEYIVIKTK